MKPSYPDRPRPGHDLAPADPPAADRLAQLFRFTIRRARVHPLQHLLQRYRAGERG